MGDRFDRPYPDGWGACRSFAVLTLPLIEPTVDDWFIGIPRIWFNAAIPPFPEGILCCCWIVPLKPLRFCIGEIWACCSIQGVTFSNGFVCWGSQDGLKLLLVAFNWCNDACALSLEAGAGDADALESEETEFLRSVSATAGDAAAAVPVVPAVPAVAFPDSPVTDVATVVVPTVPTTLDVLLSTATAAALVGEDAGSVDANFLDKGVDDLVGCDDASDGDAFEACDGDDDDDAMVQAQVSFLSIDVCIYMYT